MNLSGPYTFYVLAAYGFAIAILAGLGLAVWREHRATRRRLEHFEQDSIQRRD